MQQEPIPILAFPLKGKEWYPAPFLEVFESMQSVLASGVFRLSAKGSGAQH